MNKQSMLREFQRVTQHGLDILFPPLCAGCKRSGTILCSTARYTLQVDAIVPVPLHSERQQQRGYNHAYLLAEVCASKVKIPLHEEMVVRHRATPAQVGLPANARMQNVAGAFRCSPKPHHLPRPSGQGGVARSSFGARRWPPLSGHD